MLGRDEANQSISTLIMSHYRLPRECVIDDTQHRDRARDGRATMCASSGRFLQID